MSELDDTTFAQFARRFARIEQLVPEAPRRGFAPVVNRRSGLATLLRPAVILGALLLLAAAFALATIGSRPSPAVTIPPDSAPPAAVLDAYLRALRAGDCDTASQLTDPLFFGTWNEVLCGGSTRVTDFAGVEGPVRGSLINELYFNANLAFTSRLRGLPAGEVNFTFTLQQQSNGRWRIVDAGEQPILPFRLPTPSPKPST